MIPTRRMTCGGSCTVGRNGSRPCQRLFLRCVLLVDEVNYGLTLARIDVCKVRRARRVRTLKLASRLVQFVGVDAVKCHRVDRDLRPRAKGTLPRPAVSYRPWQSVKYSEQGRFACSVHTKKDVGVSVQIPFQRFCAPGEAFNLELYDVGHCRRREVARKRSDAVNGISTWLACARAIGEGSCRYHYQRVARLLWRRRRLL